MTEARTVSIRGFTERKSNTGILKDPNGLRAGWRLMIFLVLLCVLGFAAYEISSVLMHGHEPDYESPVFGLIYASLLFAIVLIATLIMGKIEGRIIADYGLSWRRMLCKEFWQAAAISLLSVAILLLALWRAGFYSFGPVQLHGWTVLTYGLAWAIAVIIAAVYEEFFYRGYLQFTLTSGIGFWPAALITSIFMAWMHHFNPGWTWLGLATVGGFGLIACLLLRRTGDLWMPIGLHTGWNYGEVYVFGVPSSGLMGRGHLLQGSFHGPAWATGMPFGVEAGWPNVLVFLLWLLIFSKWMRGVKYPPNPAIPPKGGGFVSRFLQTLLFGLLAATLPAQEIGHQGGDVFVPAPPPPPVTMPTPQGNSPSADQEGRLVFKSETVLVQVPVVITDKSGTHVHGLGRGDFMILENGKEQRINGFEEVSTSTAPVATKSSAPGLFSNLTLDDHPRAVTLIALDTINTPFLDQAYGRKELIKYLATNLESGQVLGLVVIGSKGVRVLSQLNSDSASLIAALKKATGEVSSMESFGAEGQVIASQGQPSALTGGTRPGEDPAEKLRQFIMNADALEGNYQQQSAIEDTMKALLEIAWSLSGIPGRKSLIWATGSFPFPLDSPSNVPGGDLSMLYERAMDALKDAQISVYPVDVRGLVSSGGDIAYSAGDSGNNVQGRSWLHNSSLDTLKTFAEMTGGRAFYNSNDLAAGFKRAADDSSSYYLLSYYMNSRNAKPGWRKLQIEVQRKDVEVRARIGFFATNATVDPDLTHKADIGLALSSPFDSTGISVTVKWQATAPDGAKKKVGFALHVPAAGIIDERDKNRFDIDFVAQASVNGTPAGNAGQTTKGTVPAASLAKIKSDGIFYQNAIELAPGTYDVRFVVRDNLTGRIGSVTAPITVN